MSVYAGPEILNDGLVLCLDAANPKSYPGSGTTWNDLSSSKAIGTWSTTPNFQSANQGFFEFITTAGPRMSFSSIPLNNTIDFTVSIFGNFQTYVGTTRPRFFFFESKRN